MELINDEHLSADEHRSLRLEEAWKRVGEHSETLNDLNLIMDSIRNGEDLRECGKAFDGVWDESLIDITALKSQELKESKRKARLMYNELKRKQHIQTTGKHSNNVFRFGKFWRVAAAAALFLGLLMPAVYHYVKKSTQTGLYQYVEAVTERGEIKTIYLPDSTKVVLNAESRLIYPECFSGEQRLVELIGEAIFDVTYYEDMPFIVETTDVEIKVLGTVFNVKAYQEDDILMISVASGKVEVNVESENILLIENRQLNLEKATGNFEKITVDAEKFMDWTDGTLHFVRTPIREVVNMLNRSYPKMVFELAEGEYNDLITGRIDTGRMEVFLDAFIQSLGFKYNKIENNIIMYK